MERERESKAKVIVSGGEQEDHKYIIALLIGN
jgi:hypothetical protein